MPSYFMLALYDLGSVNAMIHEWELFGANNVSSPVVLWVKARSFRNQCSTSLAIES